MKKLTAMIVAAVCVLTNGFTGAAEDIQVQAKEPAAAEEIQVQAKEPAAETEWIATGREEHYAGHTFFEREAEEPLTETELYSTGRQAHFGAVYTNYASYTNDLMYNRLTFAEKSLYANLYSVCEGYLTGTADVGYESGYGYFTTKAEYRNISTTRAKQVALIFDVCNPQFYFISANVLISSVRNGNRGWIQLSVYDDFVNGTARKTATAKLFTIINGYENEINTETTAIGRIKKAHDILCRDLSYDTEAENSGDTSRHQSCYTAFTEGITVCAGYSEAAELLLNGAGVPAICVTSARHEWNQVYLDGFWYLVDITWDDHDSGAVYDYYLKSDKTVLDMGYRANVYHTKDDFWGEFECPECLYDYGTAVASLSDPAESPAYVFSDRVEIGNTTGVPEGANQMYRLYNPNSGEHFYTANDYEARGLQEAGWTYEGRAWIAPISSSVPVYRLYNPYEGEHHYTIDSNERAALLGEGWQDENIGWYSDENHGVALYRVYNPNQVANNHFYTMNSYERDSLVTAGWRDEGIGWYGL